MNIARKSSLILLFVFLANVSQAVPGSPISVSEVNVAFHLFPKPRLVFPVFNHLNQIVSATIAVEMLGDDSNVVIAHHERVFQATVGDSTVTLDWPRDELPTKEVRFLSAYRLSYRLTPTRENTFQPLHGILQMGPHIADGFGIQGYPSGEFLCALDCSFLVRVAEPNSGRALAGYDIKADFGPDSDKTVMHAVSDTDGYATIHYHVPSGYAHPHLMMRLTVSREPFSTGWGGEIFWKVPPHLTLTTDKQTYHAGEIVRMHVLLTGVNKQLWAGGNLNLTITNFGGSRQLLRKKLVTSQAGEAEAQWTVPGNIESGVFSIAAGSEDEPQANWTAQDKKKIDIAPQEHPAFAVSVIPDRDHYLPGQIANLTVSSAKLEGNPIRRGKVSVKAAGDNVVFSGELDDAGRVVIPIDPKTMWDQIGERLSPGRPEPRSYDFPMDVTVTDMTNLKTESRRVLLQLARHELHLVVDDQPRVGSARTLGIVSSYVNKSAASVDGVVEAAVPDENGHCPADDDALHRTVLGNFHTNAFGVARLALPKTWINYAYPNRDDGPYSWYARVRRVNAPNEQATKHACILIRGKDKKGTAGFLTQQIAVIPETQFATRISTDHALYRPGDSIRVRIESDAGLIEAAVEIRTPGEELAGAQHVRLVNSRAEVTFPYTRRFRGLLTAHVYAVNAKDDPNTADSWSTDVIYPTGDPVKVGDRWGDELWTPDVVQPDNPNIVVTPDYERGQIAGIRKEDLMQLDPVKPIPDGMDLAGWALLGEPKSWRGWSWENYTFRHEDFDKNNLAAIKPALQKIWAQNGQRSTMEEDLVRELKEVGVDFTLLRDGWGMPYRIAFLQSGICVVSNGPDKTPNTKDDYIAQRFQVASVRWQAHHRTVSLYSAAHRVCGLLWCVLTSYSDIEPPTPGPRPFPKKGLGGHQPTG